MAQTRIIKKPNNLFTLVRYALCVCLTIVGNVHAAESIASTHRAFKDGSLSVEQNLQSYLSKIDKLEPTYNAVIAINEHALTRAKELDDMLKVGKWAGPLHGIPVLLKDNIETVDGMATTAGSLALKDNVANADATVVTKLKEAGAIILGKVNLSEWANFRSSHSSSGWSGVGGQTHNAVDATRNPCGSSAGSGVAVALQYAPIALGTETDGSVTCPASANGVYGIKPSMGSVSRAGVIPLAESQDIVGPMANSLEDLLLALSVIEGQDERDAATLAYPGSVIEASKASIKGMRIGVLEASSFTPATQRLFQQQAKQLADAGAIVIPVKIEQDLSTMYEQEFFVLLYEFKRDLNIYLKGLSGTVKVDSLASVIAFNKANSEKEMPYFGQDILESAENIDLSAKKAEYEASVKEYRLTATTVLSGLYSEHNLDVLISPTLPPAWKTDLVNGDHYIAAISTIPAIAGSAHITMPLGQVHGLPVGLSILADVNKDKEAFAAAKIIDDVLK